MPKRKRNGRDDGPPIVRRSPRHAPTLHTTTSSIGMPTQNAPSMTPYHVAIDFEQWEKCKTHQCEHHAPRNVAWGHILQPQIYEARVASAAELRNLQATIKDLRRQNETMRDDLEDYHRIFEVEEKFAAAHDGEVDLQDVSEASDSVEDQSDEQESESDGMGSTEGEEEDGEEPETEDESTDESYVEQVEDEVAADEKISAEAGEVLQKHGPRTMAMEEGADTEPEVPAVVEHSSRPAEDLKAGQQDTELADEVYESAAETVMEDPPSAVSLATNDHKTSDHIGPQLLDTVASTSQEAIVPHGLPLIPMAAPPASSAVSRVFVVILRTIHEDGEGRCELKGVFSNIVSANEAAHMVLRSLIPYLEDDEIYDKAPSELAWPNASPLGMPERRYNSNGEIRLSMDHKDLGMTFVSVVRQDLDVMPVGSSQVKSAVVDQNQIPTRPEHAWDWPSDWQSTGVSTFGYEG